MDRPGPATPADSTAAAALPVHAVPGLPGLRFRPFAGPLDYPAMVEVINAANRADGLEDLVTLERHTAEFDHLSGCDPSRDVLVAEVPERLVGFSRTYWSQRASGEWTYGLRGYLAPPFRRRGIGRAMLHWGEARARVNADGHPAGPRFFSAWIHEGEAGARALLASEGYEPARYFAEMLRPSLDGVRDSVAVPGFELRRVEPDQVRAALAADNEGFRDHWGHREATEADVAALLASPNLDPSLWIAAWDGPEIAGIQISTIDHADNAAFGRLRGTLERLSVRRPWRRRGLGRALLVAGMRVLAERGMTSVALSVDSDSPTGADALYLAEGFEVVGRSAIYRKPMAPGWATGAR